MDRDIVELDNVKGFDAGRDAPSQAPIWMGGRHLKLAKRPSQGRCRACAPALPLTVPRSGVILRQMCMRGEYLPRQWSLEFQ
jgi:hypothetical protein